MTSFAGRYTLLQKLAAGGMAELFLARQHGLEGFEKLIVLKRILPHYSDNAEFVRMLLDEARTTADLSHPNVVTIFDVGVADGTWFITMEYLRGRDLGAIFNELVRSGRRLPWSVCAHILIDVARGLHAAHTQQDSSGRALKIVHRDISPQNLFTTCDGVTKVLDFGIAHAATRSTTTEVGVLKGKISYFAPEQLEGIELDARADQFALGIVAWELLTLQRLFHRPSEAEVLRAVLEHRVPRPTSVRPELPPELEAVVLRMLAEQRHERFESCAHVADAFERWLDETQSAHSNAKTAAALSELFPPSGSGGHDQPSRAPIVPTRPGVKPSEATTRSGRQRPALSQEDDFLSAVSEFLQERPDRKKSNLVPPAGPFVGREQALAALETSLREGARLVNVVGFGGVGKTRLVQELAWRQRDEWARHGGAFFCDLREAKSLADVSKIVARALEVDVPGEAHSSDTVTQTARTLRSLGRALVVLDNFEQLVPLAEASVGQWLRLAPEVRFLVTSRESLRLATEVVYPLAPLATDGGHQSEAVRLFTTRAQLAGHPINERELTTVAAICTRLEGHALAIELAAAQLSQFTLEQLDERLQRRFEVLGTDDPTLGRHGTLWNTIDWSWQLLSPPEQTALAQLSVFRGGFTPENGVSVISLLGFALAPPRLETIAALHRKSLLCHFVAPESPRVLRLKMLESVQQFATRKLELMGHTHVDEARRRHAQRLIDVAEQCLAKLGTSSTEEAMAELHAERENLTEAFERALATLPPTAESAGVALATLRVLEPVMSRSGSSSSQLAMLDEALRLARAANIDGATLARGLEQRGNVARIRGRLGQAVADLSEALTVARTTHDASLIGRVACSRAVAHFVLGELDESFRGFDEALTLATQTEDVGARIEAHAYLAIVCMARDEPSEAIAHCDQALPLARERGDRLNEARVLGTMGGVFQDQGRLELAGAFLREAAQRCHAIRESRLEGYFLGKLAHVMLESNAIGRARSLLEQALTLVSDAGDLRHEGLFLTYLATLECLEQQNDRAKNTIGSAQARLDSVKDPLLSQALRARAMEVAINAGTCTHIEAHELITELSQRRSGHKPSSERSEEVRLAIRSLERTLREHARSPSDS